MINNKKEINKKQIGIIFSYIVVLLWMVLIFSLSSQVAEQSASLSTGVTEVIMRVVKKIAPSIDFDISKHIVRKNAHFFVYLILGMLVINALKKSDVVRYKYIALLICVLYAISDEVHQIFVPGREPGVKDVLIDSAGAGIGILIYFYIYGIVNLKKHNMG